MSCIVCIVKYRKCSSVLKETLTFQFWLFTVTFCYRNSMVKLENYVSFPKTKQKFCSILSKQIKPALHLPNVSSVLYSGTITAVHYPTH